jgi:hypothetical protein
MTSDHLLEGIWQPVYAELDGEEAPIEVLPIPACHLSSQS